MGEKATNNVTNEREWLIWIQKLKDKDGGLNELGVLVNLPGLCNILLVSVSINFDSITCHSLYFSKSIDYIL